MKEGCSFQEANSKAGTAQSDLPKLAAKLEGLAETLATEEQVGLSDIHLLTQLIYRH